MLLNGATDVDGYGSFITTISMSSVGDQVRYIYRIQVQIFLYSLHWTELFIWSFSYWNSDSYGYSLGGWLFLVWFDCVEVEWYGSL